MSGAIRHDRRVSAEEALAHPGEAPIDAEQDLLTSVRDKNDAEEPQMTQSMLENSQNPPSAILKIIVTPKRLQHFGFDPCCDCWCCNKDLRFWCTVIGPAHLVLFLVYAIVLFVSYDPDRLDDVGMKVKVSPDQQPIINYRKQKFPHFLVVSILMGATSVAAGLLIFVGARKKWRLLLYFHLVVTLILESSLGWAILLTWSPFLSALYLIGILFNVYFQIASVALTVHLKWGYYDAEIQEVTGKPGTHSNMTLMHVIE